MRPTTCSVLLVGLLGCTSQPIPPPLPTAAEVQAKPKSESDSERVQRLIGKLRGGTRDESSVAALELKEMGPSAVNAATELVTQAVKEKGMGPAIESLETVSPELFPHIVTLLKERQNYYPTCQSLQSLGPRAEPTLPALAYRAIAEAEFVNTPEGRIGGRVPMCHACLGTMEMIAPNHPLTLGATIKVCGSLKKLDNQLVRHTLHQVIPMLSKVRDVERSTEVVRLLTEFAETNSTKYGPSIPVAAIRALAEFGQEAKITIPTLKKLQYDDNADVREAATKAVRAIEK
jgi:hypothetical protein